MVTARPDAPDSGSPAVVSQQTSAPPTSETGMELEAALPSASFTSARPDLDEPSGTFAPPKIPTPQPDLPPNSLENSSTIENRFEGMLAIVNANRPQDDLNLIRWAWIFCVQHHTGQKRASGEPYIIHPLEVAQVLAEWKMDSTAIAAGLLHDAVEDTDVTPNDIAKRFGEQVAHIVEGVTKLDKIKFANREDHQAENIARCSSPWSLTSASSSSS